MRVFRFLLHKVSAAAKNHDTEQAGGYADTDGWEYLNYMHVHLFHF